MAELVAAYAGQENGKFKVGVKQLDAQPGSKSSEGIVETFDNKEDAQAFIEAVNTKPLQQPSKDGFQRSTPPM